MRLPSLLLPFVCVLAFASCAVPVSAQWQRPEGCGLYQPCLTTATSGFVYDPTSGQFVCRCHVGWSSADPCLNDCSVLTLPPRDTPVQETEIDYGMNPPPPPPPEDTPEPTDESRSSTGRLLADAASGENSNSGVDPLSTSGTTWPTDLIIAFAVGVGGIILSVIALLYLYEWQHCCLPVALPSVGESRPCWADQTDNPVTTATTILRVGALAALITALAINRWGTIDFISGTGWTSESTVRVGAFGWHAEGMDDLWYATCNSRTVACNVLLGGAIGTFVAECVAGIFLLTGLMCQLFGQHNFPRYRVLQTDLLAFVTSSLALLLWGACVHQRFARLFDGTWYEVKLGTSFWIVLGVPPAMLLCGGYQYSYWKWRNAERIRADQLQADMEMPARISQAVAQSYLAVAVPQAHVAIPVSSAVEMGGGEHIKIHNWEQVNSPASQQHQQQQQPQSLSHDDPMRMPPVSPSVCVDDVRLILPPARPILPASPSTPSAAVSPSQPSRDSRASRSMLPAGVAAPASPSSSALQLSPLALARRQVAEWRQWQQLAEKLGLNSAAEAAAFAQEQHYSQQTIEELLAADG